MKFLISTDIPSFRAVASESAHVRFCGPGPGLSMLLTSPETIDVWICNGGEVTSQLMNLWLGRACHVPKMMLVGDAATMPRLQGYSNAHMAKIAAFPPHLPPDLPRAESILRAAETLYARTRAQMEVQREPVTKDYDDKKTVLLVGAGIVNLVTAELLATRGFQVRVVDAGPDPRSCGDWTRLGVTNGGGNARMFTYTEADNYNEKGSEIYQKMRPIFRQTARNGGWSVKPPKDFSAAELAWVDAFERLPAWLARTFREDIYAVNREAGKLWREHMETTPQLFEGVELHKDILRMYAEPDALIAALELNRELGSVIHDTSPQEFLWANPGFAPAVESNDLAGGFTVEGFTLSIHSFVAKLIDRIASFGGVFTWDCRVQRMYRNDSGKVTMLESQLGRLEADHFVVSPGVTGNALLHGTASENLIQGVLGVWLQIPNLHPQLQHSIKIHRRAHLVEDINVTVGKDAETGEDILVLGGGYGFVGLDRPPPDCPELMALFSELEEVARIYFPRAHAMAKERGTMWPGESQKFCVRPFTATGLGLFERIPTATEGHLVITGGNNTGGFAQAPAVARAVWRVLVGEHDPIHVLFHPDRGRIPTAATATYRSQFPNALSPLPRKSERLALFTSELEHSFNVECCVEPVM